MWFAIILSLIFDNNFYSVDILKRNDDKMLTPTWDEIHNNLMSMYNL